MYILVYISVNYSPSPSLPFPPQPVTHYTMAILMSALSDYNSSTIHLKFALSLDPKMSEAREFLQALKCLQIFEKEEYAIKKEVRVCGVGCVGASVGVGVGMDVGVSVIGCVGCRCVWVCGCG